MTLPYPYPAPLIVLIVLINLAAGYRLVELVLGIGLVELVHIRFVDPFDPDAYGRFGERAEDDLWSWLDLWARTQLPLVSAFLALRRRKALRYIAVFLQLPFLAGLAFGLFGLFTAFLYSTVITPPKAADLPWG